jgi:hypothetical protein
LRRDGWLIFVLKTRALINVSWCNARNSILFKFETCSTRRNKRYDLSFLMRDAGADCTLSKQTPQKEAGYFCKKMKL